MGNPNGGPFPFAESSHKPIPIERKKKKAVPRLSTSSGTAKI